jgi:hypothetical protein
MQTLVLPPVRDDEHAHTDSSSYESSYSKDSYDLDTELVQPYAESVHPDVDAEPE